MLAQFLSGLMLGMGGDLVTSSGATADDGVALPLDMLEQTIGYDVDGNLSTLTVVYDGSTYVQTLTYTDGNLTGVSVWVKQ